MSEKSQTTQYLHQGLPISQLRMAVNKSLVEIIRSALSAINNGYQRTKNSYGVDYKYLLNQSIRQYVIPTSNLHMTVAADKLWQALGISESILLYRYQDAILPKQTLLSVQTCKGPSKRIELVDVFANQSIPFNLLFIEEHTTPVSDVIKALKAAYSANPTDQTIVDVLDKMHITKMLKIENKGILLSSKRICPNDYNKLDAIDIFHRIKNDHRVKYPLIKSTKNYRPIYTSAEIMEDCHPELWKRAQGQVDRLVELQEKLLDRFKDFQKPMTDPEAYIYFRSVFAFAHELWNVLDGRCLSLARASNGADYVAVDDAICELQYMLGFLDEIQMEEICDDGFGILNLNALLLQHKPRIDFVVFPRCWRFSDIAGCYSGHGKHPEDLLEIAGADAIPETVTIGKLLDDDTLVRIY